MRTLRLALGDGVAGWLQLHGFRQIWLAGSTAAGDQNNGRFAAFM